MFSNQLIATAHAARRILPSLGLVAVLLTSTLGPPAPALADDPDVRDHRNGGPPAARIQILLKSVHILDDRDPGDGEMDFRYSLVCFATPTPCLGYGSAFLDGYGRSFSAGSGETVALDHVLPSTERTDSRYDASVETGYPLRPGHEYELRFDITEKDPFGNDEQMGDVWIRLTQENGWGVGNHRVRSVRRGVPGDYEVELEVRKVPLPDLRAVNIIVSDLPNSTEKRVCMAVQNIAGVPAGPFQVVLRVDGVVPPDGRATAIGIDPYTYTEVCVDTELGAPGQRKLQVVADGLNALLEFNEANNLYEQAYTVAPRQVATPAPASPTPQADTTPGAAKADLTVGAIRVNGRVPDGKVDCKDGKNDVAVVVKNVGTADAESFVVRLAVDAAEAGAESVADLEASDEREVRFEDVRLKKGEWKLAATVDSKGAVAESKDDNNALKVTVGCTAG